MPDNVFCNDCGTPIEGPSALANDLNQREPCPRCGSRIRRVNMSARGGSSVSGWAGMTLVPYSETLLGKASGLIESGEFGLATILAHTACEVAAERAMSRAITERGIADLEVAIFKILSNSNLGNERTSKFYEPLTGDKITEQGFWSEFTCSAKRRNGTVHKGQQITKSQAEASYKAASELVAHLAKVATSRS
jgi:hypothetical protein